MRCKVNKSDQIFKRGLQLINLNSVTYHQPDNAAVLLTLRPEDRLGRASIVHL